MTLISICFPKLIDKNKDGYLSKAELKLINKDASMGDIIKTIDAFDLDKDGKLNYAEFVRIFSS